VPQLQLARELAAQKARGAAQPGEHFSTRMPAGKRQHADMGYRQIRRELNGRDRDVADARILDVPTQHLRQRTLHLRRDTSAAGAGFGSHACASCSLNHA
jgi:hypothetical protein